MPNSIIPNGIIPIGITNMNKKKETIMNPFRYGCTVNGDFFCPRPVLERELASRIESGQNVVMQGDRRTGKTSLVIETVRHMKNIALFHADFLCVRDQADVCRRLVAAIARLEDSESWATKTLRMLAHLRPTVSIDPSSGSPTVTVDARVAAEPTTLDSVLDVLLEQTKRRKICVLLDEFQDILDIDDGERTLAVLRSRIQLDANTPYIFLGSVRNKMAEIFFKYSSPFYHSAASFKVGNIDADDFFEFIKRRFATGGRILPRLVFDAIAHTAHETPGFVQELCDALWQTSDNGTTLEESDIKKALAIIFAREHDHFTFAIKQLTALQTRVLRTIAERGGKEIFSSAFLAEAQIFNAASVKKAVEKLEREDIIYNYGGEYRFVSPFFGEWLLRR